MPSQKPISSPKSSASPVRRHNRIRRESIACGHGAGVSRRAVRSSYKRFRGPDSSSPDRRGSWLLPQPYGYCSRNRRAAPTSRRPEKEAATTSIKPSGSAVLDGPAHDVVSLAGCLSDRQIRNGGGLASGRLPPVLALEIAAAWRPAEDLAGSSRVDSPLGPGECRLGRAEDPRGCSSAAYSRSRLQRSRAPPATVS